MSPRHHRSRRDGTPPARDGDTGDCLVRVERWAGGEWMVRPVTGASATKTYRCPGCDQQIRAGVPHVVTWPADAPGDDAGLAQRRHWHRPCWHARDRRRAKDLRARNAPRYG